MGTHEVIYPTIEVDYGLTLEQMIERSGLTLSTGFGIEREHYGRFELSPFEGVRRRQCRLFEDPWCLQLVSRADDSKRYTAPEATSMMAEATDLFGSWRPATIEDVLAFGSTHAELVSCWIAGFGSNITSEMPGARPTFEVEHYPALWPTKDGPIVQCTYPDRWVADQNMWGFKYGGRLLGVRDII